MNVIIINPTPTVDVLKVKKGTPTVIEYDGERYTLQHRDQFKRGGKSGRNRAQEQR